MNLNIPAWTDHAIDPLKENIINCCKKGELFFPPYIPFLAYFPKLFGNKTRRRIERSGNGNETENKRGGWRTLGTGFAWLRSIILLFYLACLRGDGKRRAQRRGQFIMQWRRILARGEDKRVAELERADFTQEWHGGGLGQW